MRLSAFVVKDEKAEGYAHPFFAPTSAMAVRMFGDWIQTPDNVLNKHPEDYSLFRVGFFDDESCSFGNEATPVLLCSGRDFVKIADKVSSIKRGA